MQKPLHHLTNLFLKTILGSLFLWPHGVFAQNTCTVNDGKNFQTYLSLHPEIKHIIFFSTWCSDCKEKLLELKKKEELSKEYLLVNSFDQKGHGEKALEYLKISLPCFYDPNNLIAKEYNIFVVPGEVQR